MSEDLSVYVSSTFSDLAPYRAAVNDAIVRLGLRPVGLEQFPATDEDALTVGARAVLDADVFVILVGVRYGSSFPNSGGKSGTELEYEEAISAGKPIFVFVMADDVPVPLDEIDLQNLELVQGFKRRLLANHVVSRFSSPDDLLVKAMQALFSFSTEVDIALPAIDTAVAETDVTLSELFEELRNLRLEIGLMRNSLQERTASSPSIEFALRVGETHLVSASFLGCPSPAEVANRCFIVMPYSQPWSSAVERIVFEVCSSVGFEFSIAKNMGGRFIPHDIWAGITAASVIVADLSGANPNVTYEIGLADVINKCVILIGQDVDVPFDFHGQRLITYENTVAGGLALREQLEHRLRQILDTQRIDNT